MATLRCDVATGTDDFDIEIVGDPNTTASTETLIWAKRLRDGGSVLTVSNNSYVNIDTSGIDSSWIITAATLNWYTNSYATTPKGDPEGSSIYMKNSSDVWTAIESSTSNRIVGWESYSLDATECGYILDAGYTQFRFDISDPVTANESRTWSIRSYEHTASNGYSVYLNVEYKIPRRRIFIIG